MSTVATRTPTIRFPRLHAFEIGQLAVVFWNGTFAGNGDGVPGGANPVDYATPLAGPIEIWPAGKASAYGGGFGRGGFGVCRANPVIGHGFASGPFGAGGFCGPGGFFGWRPPFNLRDGNYKFGVRMRDKLGNETASPAIELTFSVAAVPRPATRARLDSYTPGNDTLTFSWQHSPDLG